MIELAWPAWILAIGVVAALACIAIGAARAGVAFARFSRHLKRTQSDAKAMVDVQRTQAALARMESAADGILPLIARAQRALLTIQTALQTLRLPEAMLALRAANAAVRLLVSGR